MSTPLPLFPEDNLRVALGILGQGTGVVFMDTLALSEYACLSLWQPWASLVVLGAKRWETRSWATRYRGRLLIHATKRFDAENRALCREEPFRSALAKHGYTDPSQLPLGAILGGVYLRHIHRTDVARPLVGNDEVAMGDWSKGRYAWQLGNPRVLRTPLPTAGGQQLWTYRPTP